MEKFNAGLFCKEDKILVALSGGADSIACLYYIYDNIKPLEIMAFHLNHKLRTDADSDMQFCQEVCKKLKIKLIVEEIEIAKEAKSLKKSLEETGRIIRYKFLKEIAKNHKISKIITAHHADDNIESILMQFISGTGGLHAGISEAIQLENNLQIIRPLLRVSKPDIYEYCAINKIVFREDSTNLESDFKRNKLRNIIIPLIKKQINPNLEKSMERYKAVSDEMSSFIDAYIAKVLVNIIKDNKYSITYFNAENIFIKKEIIKKLLLALSIRFSFEQIQSVLDFIEAEHPNSRLKLANNYELIKEYNYFFVGLAKPIQDLSKTLLRIKKGENIFYNVSLQVNFPSNAVIDKSNKQRFILDADTVDFESLILRKRKAGDSLCPLGSAQPVSLKEFFIKRKIPLSLRNSHVVLADKNGIIAILGYEIAERVKLIGTSSKYLELVFSTTATQSGLPLNPPHRGGRCKSHPL